MTMRKDDVQKMHEGKDIEMRRWRRLRTPAYTAAVVLALLCALIVLPGCDDVASNSPNVAPTTDYPVHEASTITSTYDNVDSTAMQQGVTPGDPNVATATGSNTATATTTAVAEQVINGDWGNGQDRVDALTNAGYDASLVQQEVNAILQADTTDDEPIVQQPEDTTQGTDDDSGSQVTWHDEITEPIYENQPVYKYCYTYTFTAVNGKSVSPQVTSSSDFSYDTSAAAETAANGSAAQTAALNAIRAAHYDAGTLAACTYTISTSSKQTGTKRVQTGTRVVQKAGWY